MAEELKTNKSTYIYGLLVLSLIVAIAVALLLIRPLMEDNKTKQSTIDQKKTNLETLEAKKSKLEELQLKTSEIKDKSEIVKKAIPKDKEDEKFYFELEMIAQQSGATVNSIDKDLSATGAVDAMGQPIVSSYNSRTYSVSLTTNYPALTQILSDLQNALRLTSVDKIDIKVKEGNIIDATLTVTVYDTAQGDTNEQL